MGDFNIQDDNNGGQQSNANPETSSYQQPQQNQYQQPQQSQYQQPQQNQYQQPQQNQYQQPQQNQYQQPQQNQYQQPQYQQPQYGGQTQYQQPQQNQYQQSQQGQYRQSYPQQAPNKINPLALASTICGGVGFLMSCCLFFIALPVSIAGIVLGIISLRNNKDNKTDKILSIVGIALSGVTFLISSLVLVFIIIGDSTFGSWSNWYNSSDIWNSY